MIAPCSKCTDLFDRTKAAVTTCARCTSLDRLLKVADCLVKWHGTVDVVSGTAAADQLGGIVDMAAVAAAEARAL